MSGLPEEAVAPTRIGSRSRVSFERLRERTDELELLISGLTLLGLLAFPGWLIEQYHGVSARLPVVFLAGAQIALPMMIAFAYSLALSLMLHLAVRAYWVGLIGLHTIFPDGIRWETPLLGPIVRERLQARGSDLDAAIARADRLASMLFSLIILIALVLACFGAWATVAIMGGALLGALWGGTNQMIVNAFFALASVVICGPILLWLLDSVLARRFTRLQQNRVYRAVVRRLSQLLGWMFPERLLAPLRLTLQTHMSAWVFVPLLAGLVIALPMIGFTLFGAAQSFDVFGNQTYLRAGDLGEAHRDQFYESQRGAIRNALRGDPMIPAPVIETGWLPLFLPYVPTRDNPLLAQRCPPRPEADNAAGGFPNPEDSDEAARQREQAASERSQAAAACLATLWQVHLNGRAVDLTGFLPAQRSDLGFRGLSGYIDLRQETPGPQRLEVFFRPHPQSDQITEDYIPPRVRSVIPFLWSPEIATAAQSGHEAATDNKQP